MGTGSQEHSVVSHLSGGQREMWWRSSKPKRGEARREAVMPQRGPSGAQVRVWGSQRPVPPPLSPQTKKWVELLLQCSQLLGNECLQETARGHSNPKQTPELSNLFPFPISTELTGGPRVQGLVTWAGGGGAINS